MPTVSPVLRFLSAPLVGALLVIGACESTPSDGASASAPDRAELKNEVAAAAEVIQIDRTNRLVTLQTEAGQLLTIRAGEGVRNFEQIAEGDKLRVRYSQKLTVVRNPPETPTEPPQAALAASRSPSGSKPAGEAGVAVRMVVKIESLDLAHDIVVFSMDSGELITHRLGTPEGRAFAKGLHVGDKVALEYSEALAMSIDEM